MTGSSSPHFIEPVEPVDPLTCRVLRLIDHAAATSGARYFVAGATARDLLLVNAFGMTPGRATRDIDFGIAVGNREQFILAGCAISSCCAEGFSVSKVQLLLSLLAWRE